MSDNAGYGWKLVRKRKDGTLGPLFINRRQRLPVNKWLKAEDHPTKGFAHRPGWHVCSKRYAPHLSKKGRVWVRVLFIDAEVHVRPKRQGGVWYVARWIRLQ